MPSASLSRTIKAPRQRVWALLSDIAGARAWNATWSLIEMTSKQTHGVGTRFQATTADGDEFEFEVTSWIAPEEIAFSPIRDDGERYGIMLESQTFRLKEGGEDETIVELTARASAHGIRGRFVAQFFWRGYQEHGLEGALDALQSVFEPDESNATAAEATPANE
jgi:uncharacterized protein YndB with AHSA1/START domain